MLGLIARKRAWERCRPYERRLLGYAYALTRDRDAAEDLLQECLVRSTSAGRLPEAEAALRAWLFTVMRNLWVDRLRRERRRAVAEELLAQDGAGPPTPGADTADILAVRIAFATLSDDHREVLALVDIAGFTYQEAAELLSVPPGTVMSRVSRARAALALRLDGGKVVPFTRRWRDKP